MTEAGQLYVVATPIGCLGDITLRALEVLRLVDVVLAEDTRRTRVLLKHYDIATRLESFHAHSPDQKVRDWLEAMQRGARVALVSDAGMPLLSDPGASLVEAASDAGVRVEAIPGPSAITAALVVSGLPCDEFRFVGFLPRSGSRRDRALDRIASDEAATVVFESPKRIGRTLRDLASKLESGRRIAVCRELTKVHEEVVRDTPQALLDHFGPETRGEVTLVIEGGRGTETPKDSKIVSVDEALDSIRVLELGAKSSAHELARLTGLPRKEAYRRVLARIEAGRVGEGEPQN